MDKEEEEGEEKKKKTSLNWRTGSMKKRGDISNCLITME